MANNFLKCKDIFIFYMNSANCHKISRLAHKYIILWFCMSEVWHGPHWDKIKVLAGLHSFLESFSSVQSLSHVRLFVTLWTAACQPSLSITNSWSLLKLVSIESVMPSNHLILCLPLLLLPSIFPSIRLFSNESVLRIRWLQYGSFSFSIWKV